MVAKIDEPMSAKMMTPVTRCSITPTSLENNIEGHVDKVSINLKFYRAKLYFGASPGTLVALTFLRAIIWFIDKTVAATNHGMPNTELIPMQIAQIKRSRW